MRCTTTLSGKEFLVTVDGSSVMIGAANVVATDILANNGLIHVIDTVLTTPFYNLSPLHRFGETCMSVTSQRARPGSTIRMMPCAIPSARQHFRLQDNMLLLELGDDTKCIQAGLAGPPKDGEYLRVKECDPTVDIQKFTWKNGESAIMLMQYPNLCVANAGVTIENGDLLIIKECDVLLRSRAVFKATF